MRNFGKIMLVILQVLILLTGVMDKSGAAESRYGSEGNNRLMVDFTYETFTGSRMTIPYRKAEVNADAGDGLALVICLHGHSASGDDNEKQMRKKAVRNSTEYFWQEKKGAIILAPQCPKDYKWHSREMVTVLRELIASYEGKVDKSRIYVLGDSMGGDGAWALISTYPDLFAAAMPVAATVRGELPPMVKTPICAVVGEKDEIVSAKNVAADVKSLVAMGAEVNFEILAGATHRETCGSAFTAERLGWVFKHKR